VLLRTLGVIFPSLQNLAKFYNNLENINDRASLLSCICCLSNIAEFNRAGFIFSSDSVFENVHRKNNKEEFAPAYAGKKILAYHEEQFKEKKIFFCQTLRWALAEPNFFQKSNISLLKRGLCPFFGWNE
jgi:hypothetical protein